MLWATQILILFNLWMVFPQIVMGNDDNKGQECMEPEVKNGQVTTTKSSGNFRVVNVECDPSYVRVGKSLIKCYNGQWSAKIPSCTRIGSCEIRDLPLVDNARRIPVKGFRGSVVKIKCHSHFKLLGEHLAHCVDDKKWSLQEAPVCTRNACDENEMNQIAYGTSQKLHGFRGAVYQFQCNEGATLAGSPTVYCDGKKWNATIPTCISPPGEPDLKVFVDNEPTGRSDSQLVLRAGQHIELRCTARGGNPIPSLTFTKNGQSFGSGPQAYQNTYNYVVTPEDHDAVLGCTAQNQADRRADSPEIKLNVLYPPERLTIEGPEELTQDHEARFTCKASASNLPGQLTFKLTSHHADLLDELVTSGLVEIEPLKEKWIDSNDRLENVQNSGWKTTRSLILKPELLQRADQLDGQLTFECQVPDPYNERHILKQATTFVALINPVPETQALGLKISGPKQVLFNEQARFKCSANQKGIELDMNVYQDNKNTLKSEIKTFNDGHGEIRLNPGDVQHGTQQFYIECGAYNSDKDWDSVKHFVEVLYPPGNPTITGLDHALLSGSAHKLTCVTKAGHPPAKLNWFKGSAMMESHYTVEGDLVKAEISFVPQPEDNGSEIRCEAVNEAIPKRVSETGTITLDVSENTNVAAGDSNVINTSTRSSTSGTSSEYDDEYENYDDEYYQYPDTTYSTDDPQFTHPEFTDNTLFEGTVKLTQEDPKRPHHKSRIINPSLDSNTLDIAEKSRTSKNYPRDEAYTGITAGSSELSVSLMVFIVSWLALRF